MFQFRATQDTVTFRDMSSTDRNVGDIPIAFHLKTKE